MDAIEPLLRPIVALINRRIRSSTPALDLCTELAGQSAAFRVSNTALAAYAIVDPDGIRLVGDSNTDPDVIISGSPLALASLGGPDPRAAFRDGRLTITGDADLAESFQRLMQLARPDIEEEVSRLLGDATAHQLGRTVNDVIGWGRDTVRNLGDVFGQRIAADGALPSHDDVAEFTAEVREARDAAGRLEARVRKLAQRSGDSKN